MSSPVGRRFRRCTAIAGVPALLLFATVLVEGHPTALFAPGPATSNFYDVQAHMLLAGRIDMPPETVAWEGIVRDGRTYVYWGIVPTLIRLPIAAVTHRLDGRLTRVALLGAFALALLGSAWLLWLARAPGGLTGPLARDERLAVAGFVALVGAASPVLFLASRPVVYHEAELWGLAMALCAYAALIRYWETPSGARLAVVSTLAALAFNARPAVGAGPVAALVLVLAMGVWRGEAARTLAARTLAVAFPVVLYATVNFARFGSPFDYPLRDQLFARMNPDMKAALAANGGRLFGLHFVPTTLLQYLRPDAIRPWRLFPFLTFHRPIHVVGDATFYSLDETSSLVAASPALCALAILALPGLLRAKQSTGWQLGVAGALVGTAPTLTAAFIANRYLVDFLPVVIVPAAVGVPRLLALLRAHPVWRPAAVSGLVALGVWALLANLALALQNQRLFVLPTVEGRRDFVALQYDLDARLFGGVPPNVARSATLPGDAAVGTVAIVGDCDGLYWKDRWLWYALERGSGNRFHRLVGAPPPGRSVVVSGPRWEVTMVIEGPSARFVYLATGRDEVTTSPALALQPGRPLEIDVVTDPATAEVQVAVHGERLLDLWFVDASGPVSVGSPWSEVPVRAPLCERLRARLELAERRE